MGPGTGSGGVGSGSDEYSFTRDYFRRMIMPTRRPRAMKRLSADVAWQRPSAG